MDNNSNGPVAFHLDRLDARARRAREMLASIGTLSIPTANAIALPSGALVRSTSVASHNLPCACCAEKVRGGWRWVQPDGKPVCPDCVEQAFDDAWRNELVAVEDEMRELRCAQQRDAEREAHARRIAIDDAEALAHSVEPPEDLAWASGEAPECIGVDLNGARIVIVRRVYGYGRSSGETYWTSVLECLPSRRHSTSRPMAYRSERSTSRDHARSLARYAIDYEVSERLWQILPEGHGRDHFALSDHDARRGMRRNWCDLSSRAQDDVRAALSDADYSNPTAISRTLVTFDRWQRGEL